MIVRNERVNNEFYVAPVYNYAIKQGKKFGIYTIDKTGSWCFYYLFLQENPIVRG